MNDDWIVNALLSIAGVGFLCAVIYVVAGCISGKLKDMPAPCGHVENMLIPQPNGGIMILPVFHADVCEDAR